MAGKLLIMDGLSVQNVVRDGHFYIMSDDQIIQSPTTAIGQVESERIMSVPRIRNHNC
jgi:hypothetical protein